MTQPNGMTLRRRLAWAWISALAALLAFAAPTWAQSPARQRSLGIVRIAPAGSAEQSLYDESHALVIGASAYRNGWHRLPGVPDDIIAVKAVLELQGFDVETLADPTRDQLDAALRRFVSLYGQRLGNRLLVYFAGHGHTLKTNAGVQLGYIVPIDAPRPDRDLGGFKERAISMETIEVLAKQMDSRHALFIFDSCFSGTIFRTRGGAPDTITAKTAAPVRQFITAGDENQAVPDVSVFRRQLVAALKDGDADLNHDGYITASELGMYLEDQVTNYSKKTQTPRWGKISNPDLDKGDFVFVSPRLAAPQSRIAEPALRIASADEVEQQFWNVIQNSTDAQDFKDYLDRYPNGRFVVLARRQWRLLTVAQAPVAAAASAPTRPAVPTVRPAGSVFKDCDDCPEMVVVPAGIFMMGSPASEEGRFQDEGPQRLIAIPDKFAMGRHELTVEEFGRFVESTHYLSDAERNAADKQGCYALDDKEKKWDWRGGRNWREPGFAQQGRQPVVCVSWNDAHAYTEWLSRKTGQHYRLPSESEWEYAARAGSTTSRPWGNDPKQACAHANVADWSKSPGGDIWSVPRHECNDRHWYTAQVGGYAANRFNLKDMIGNAAEWVQDCYDAKVYENGNAPIDGRAYEVDGCSVRALRGGSWSISPRNARSANRIGLPADDRNGSIGFRLARMLP